MAFARFDLTRCGAFFSLKRVWQHVFAGSNAVGDFLSVDSMECHEQGGMRFSIALVWSCATLRLRGRCLHKKNAHSAHQDLEVCIFQHDHSKCAVRVFFFLSAGSPVWIRQLLTPVTSPAKPSAPEKKKKKHRPRKWHCGIEHVTSLAVPTYPSQKKN